MPYSTSGMLSGPDYPNVSVWRL